jgi:shikimate dehydrogenase
MTPLMQLQLLGFPLGHSVSPAMHTAALAEVGLSGWSYAASPVPPDRLEAAVDALRQPAQAGANVTVPHKQAIMPLLDGVTPVAAAIGAVNTVVKQPDGRLIGHNTDAAGFLADLHTLGVHISGRPVLVLGAGGSARAVAAACAGVGARLRLAARRREQAESLQSLAILTVYDWTPLGLLQACDDVALIVNCTPLGMAPNTDASPWLDGIPFPPSAFMYDLVYNPAQTRLTRDAQTAGLRASTGLGMLVEQGALAFELWTGHAAPRATMRRAAEAALAAASTLGARIVERS